VRFSHFQKQARASVVFSAPSGKIDRMDKLVMWTGGAPASGVLLAVIVAVSLAGLLMPALIERSLFRPYWLVPRSEYSTLVTSGFVHADLTHLLFNGFTFWAFAFGLERHIGSERFLALYAFGLLMSDAGTWLRHRHEPDYRTLGASGAITAVLFASIVYFPSASIFILPIPVPIPSPLFALAYLGYTWYASRQPRGRINHDAHFYGALAGIAFVAASDGAAIGRAWRHLAG
jgi:membrane associated rhomboid family serine protease